MVRLSRDPNEPRGAYVHQGLGYHGFCCDRIHSYIRQQLAQWAASRVDLFPALLCERMGKMHSRGRPHSLAYTKQVIERVFRRPFDEVFEMFDEKPIGSGAIAQVCHVWPLWSTNSNIF